MLTYYTHKGQICLMVMADGPSCVLLRTQGAGQTSAPVVTLKSASEISRLEMSEIS